MFNSDWWIRIAARSSPKAKGVKGAQRGVQEVLNNSRKVTHVKQKRSGLEQQPESVT